MIAYILYYSFHYQTFKKAFLIEELVDKEPGYSIVLNDRIFVLAAVINNQVMQIKPKYQTPYETLYYVFGSNSFKFDKLSQEEFRPANDKYSFTLN